MTSLSVSTLTFSLYTCDLLIFYCFVAWTYHVQPHWACATFGKCCYTCLLLISLTCCHTLDHPALKTTCKQPSDDSNKVWKPYGRTRRCQVSTNSIYYLYQLMSKCHTHPSPHHTTLDSLHWRLTNSPSCNPTHMHDDEDAQPRTQDNNDKTQVSTQIARFKLPPQAHLPNTCLHPMTSQCCYVNAAMDPGEHTHIPLSKLLTILTCTHMPIPHTHLRVHQSASTGPSMVCHPCPPIQPIHKQLVLHQPPHLCK